MSELTDSSSSERISTQGHGSPSGPRSADVGHAWLAIHEASELLGVSEATLRRWSAAGDVEAFTTPGGHRRFSRSSILRLLPPVGRHHRTLRELGETPERIVRVYRREIGGASASEWLPQLSGEEREAFREPGREILAGVLGYLDAPTGATGEVHLDRARAGARAYGRLAGSRGIGVTATIRAFLHFRSPFLEELATVARRRRLDTTQAIGLVIAAATTFDRLLPPLIESHLASADPGPEAAPKDGAR